MLKVGLFLVILMLSLGVGHGQEPSVTSIEDAKNCKIKSFKTKKHSICDALNILSDKYHFKFLVITSTWNDSSPRISLALKNSNLKLALDKLVKLHSKDFKWYVKKGVFIIHKNKLPASFHAKKISLKLKNGFISSLFHKINGFVQNDILASASLGNLNGVYLKVDEPSIGPIEFKNVSFMDALIEVLSLSENGTIYMKSRKLEKKWMANYFIGSWNVLSNHSFEQLIKIIRTEVLEKEYHSNKLLAARDSLASRIDGLRFILKKLELKQIKNEKIRQALILTLSLSQLSLDEKSEEIQKMQHIFYEELNSKNETRILNSFECYHYWLGPRGHYKPNDEAIKLLFSLLNSKNKSISDGAVGVLDLLNDYKHLNSVNSSKVDQLIKDIIEKNKSGK